MTKIAWPFVGWNNPLVRHILPFICPFVGFAYPLVPAPIRCESPGQQRHVSPQRINSRNAQTGLTVIELMVTMGVIGITAAIAYPNFDAYVTNSRLVTSTNDLVASMQLARAEAIKRGVTTVLCRSANPGAGAPTCGGTANDWSTGWLIYALPDTGAERNYDSATDTLIRTGAGSQRGVSITSDTTGNAWLAYNRDGTLNETASAEYAVCDGRGATEGRLVSVSLTGRPATSRTVPGNTNLDCTPT